MCSCPPRLSQHPTVSPPWPVLEALGLRVRDGQLSPGELQAGVRRRAQAAALLWEMQRERPSQIPCGSPLPPSPGWVHLRSRAASHPARARGLRRQYLSPLSPWNLNRRCPGTVLSALSVRSQQTDITREPRLPTCWIRVCTLTRPAGD